MNIDCDWCICGKRALDGKLYCSYECQIKDAASLASSTTATPSASSSLSSSSAFSFISSSTLVNNISIPLNYNTSNPYNVNFNLPRHNIPTQAWDPFRRRYSLPAVLQQSHNKANQFNYNNNNNNYKNNTIFSNSKINSTTSSLSSTCINVNRFLNRSNSCYAFYNRKNTQTNNQPPVIHTTTTTSYYSCHKNNNNNNSNDINSNNIVTVNAINQNNHNTSLISSNISQNYQQLPHCHNSHYFNKKSISNIKEDSIKSMNNDDITSKNHISYRDSMNLKKEPIIIINLSEDNNNDNRNNDNNNYENNYNNKINNDNNNNNNNVLNKYSNIEIKIDYSNNIDINNNNSKIKNINNINNNYIIKDNKKKNPNLLGSYIPPSTLTSNSLITNALSRRSSLISTSTINTTEANVMASTTYTTSYMNDHDRNIDNNKNKNTSLEELLKKSNLLNREYKIKDKNSDLNNKWFSFSYKKFFIRKNMNSIHKFQFHNNNNNNNNNSNNNRNNSNSYNNNIITTKKSTINSNNDNKEWFNNNYSKNEVNQSTCNDFDIEKENNVYQQISKKTGNKKEEKQSNHSMLNKLGEINEALNDTINKNVPININTKRRGSNPKNIVYKNKRSNINSQRQLDFIDQDIKSINNSFIDESKYLIDNDNDNLIGHSLLVDDSDIYKDNSLLSEKSRSSNNNDYYDLMTKFSMDDNIDDMDNEDELLSKNYSMINNNSNYEDPIQESSFTNNIYIGNNLSFDKFIERNKEDTMYLINKNFRFGYNDDDQFCINDYYYDGNEEVLNKRQFYKKGSEIDKSLQRKIGHNQTINSKTECETNKEINTENNLYFKNDLNQFDNSVKKENNDSNKYYNIPNNKPIPDFQINDTLKTQIKGVNDSLNSKSIFPIATIYEEKSQPFSTEIHSNDSTVNDLPLNNKLEINDNEVNNYDEIRDKILKLNSVDSNTEIYQNNSPSVKLIFYSTPDTKKCTYGIININNEKTTTTTIKDENSSIYNRNNRSIKRKNPYIYDNIKQNKVIDNRKLDNQLTINKYLWLPNYLKDDDLDDMDSLYI